MECSFARMWWVMALRGIVGILFGGVTFFWPGLAWFVVVATFAGFALANGVFGLYAALTGRTDGRPRWALGVEGVLGIAAAVVTVIWPGLTALALLWVIASWAVVTGVFAVIAAVRLRKEIEGEWALALSGILSVVFGLCLLVLPVAGALAIAWLIATYAIAYGVLYLGLAFRLRRLARRPAPVAVPSPVDSRAVAAS